MAEFEQVQKLFEDAQSYKARRVIEFDEKNFPEYIESKIGKKNPPKEFSNWKSISNAHDIDIFFADPGCPGQRGLNEHSNGLLRRNGLPKQMDFTNISQNYLSAIADKRNRIPRKSLNYQTPYQVFLSYLKSLT